MTEPGFRINDRRGETRSRSEDGPLSHSRFTRNGMQVRRVVEDTGKGMGGQNPFGAPRMDRQKDTDTLNAMSRTRMAMTRKASTSGTAPSVQMAQGRPRDPMWYWKQNNIPFNFTEPAEMQRIREFCNTPDAPITMADGTLKTLGDIVVGDEVRGWNYDHPPNSVGYSGWTYGVNGGKIRNYVAAEVLAIATRTAPAVLVELANGGSMVCTPDHYWANPHYGTQVQYNSDYPPKPTTGLMTTEYRIAEVGQEVLDVTNGMMTKVVSITPQSSTTVVSMETTTGNYIAWGIASRNCRLLYVTHPIVAACTDIFAKYPLQGLHFECKDEKLVDFYSELFFDQLNYEEHLLDVGTEYWNVGESWTLGAWNDTLGVWEGDQLINPDDVEIENTLFMDEPRFLMRLPETLRRILTSRTPRYAYQQLVSRFPELLLYTSQDSLMPVSNVILKQMRFKADRFSNRGIPILMRGFRAIMQEEMLNSALDSIADRLYTPLILTKLGATAQDLGTTVPWIPDQNEMDDFNAALDMALAADFRALTYHWAVDIQPVFGRENVPDLSNDFDRLTERLLMVYGLSQTMLTGANAGETYAADALNRDVVTQLLSHYQRSLSRLYRDRALIVAEAQEHFDYEVRNGKRFLITEEIYEVDEESGEGRIVEQPKLLIPDLKFKILNLTDEDAERQFLEALSEAGVPVPYKARVSTTGLDFDEMVEQRSAEQVQLAVAEQETRKKTYLALKSGGYPIPDDLQTDFGPKAIMNDGNNPAASSFGDQTIPSLGQMPLDLPVLAPTPDELQQLDPNADPMAVASDQDSNMNGIPDNDETGADPAADEGDDSNLPQEGDDRPEESDEQRARMPKKLARSAPPIRMLGIRKVTIENYDPPDNSQEQSPRDYQPTGYFATPKHMGMRRHLAPVIPEELKAHPRKDE